MRRLNSSIVVCLIVAAIVTTFGPTAARAQQARHAAAMQQLSQRVQARFNASSFGHLNLNFTAPTHIPGHGHKHGHKFHHRRYFFHKRVFVYPNHGYAYYDYGYPYTYTPSYRYDYRPRTVSYQVAPPAPADPWALLTDGEYRQAVSKFALQTAREPTDARGYLGYAIASLMTNDQRQAAWAMRRAIEMAGDRIRLIDLGDLKQRLTEQRNQLAAAAPDPSRPQDTHFIIAALSYLLGDADTAAADALDAAIKQGDYSKGAEKLKALLAE